MHTIETTIDISAPAHRVLEALTTKDGIRAWFTDDVSCDADKRQVTYRFATAAGTKAVTFQLDARTDTRVDMTCIAEHLNPEWLGTTLTYQLASVAGGTRFTLVHRGFVARSECYEQCTKGWAHFAGSLKLLLETGAGTPHAPRAAA
jgi:uncharacterized protein YndB with AHSA1/START domain